MARTITALFDSRADAEAGAERLRVAGIAAGHVAVHDQTGHATAGANSTAEDRGLWASIKYAFLPDADRHTYEEGLRRGGFLLTADIDDDAAPTAIAALEDANTIDLDERTQQWRTEGWAGPIGTASADEAGLYGSLDTDYSGSRTRSYSARPFADDREI